MYEKKIPGSDLVVTQDKVEMSGRPRFYSVVDSQAAEVVATITAHGFDSYELTAADHAPVTGTSVLEVVQTFDASRVKL